jgi:hypothetical protein
MQEKKLVEADFRGERFPAHGEDLKGNYDVLCLTRPEVVASVHRAYLEAGADIIETNTFSATSIAQSDYGLQDHVAEMNFAAARIARECADAAAAADGRPRFVAGVLGPDQPHRLDLAGRQRPRQAQRALRRAGGRLPRGGARAGRRRRGPPDGRDGVRHAERARRAVRARGDVRGRGIPAAGDGLGHHHRRLRPHAVGPDRRGLLELRAPRAAAGRGLQLRARRRAAAPARRGAVAPRRHLRQRAPERRPAERLRRLRPGRGDHGGADRRVRRQRLRQPRRRLLRHAPRAHRGAGRGDPRQGAAASCRSARAPAG